MTGGQVVMIREDLFGLDQKVQRAIGFAKNISVTKSPVLIVGESGTGKRTLGNFIHEHSSRASKPILIVDCAEDPKKVENEILGYREEESGRFIQGVLERGNTGSVIFANLDSLDETFQKRLHKIFLELEDYDLDVRILATTTKNLSKLVGSGRFYRGLYTYISSSQINLPPLRERIEDIEYIARELVKDIGLNEVRLSNEALEKILSHYWTHNIQEMKSVIESTIDECEENIIELSHLTIGEKKTTPFSHEDDEDGLKLMSLKEAERLLIKKALIHTSENRTQAAKILGVSIRTLRNKINEYRNSGKSYFVNLR